MHWILKVAAILGATYYLDVPYRRSSAAKAARLYANRSGKPLLNVGAGISGVGLWSGSSRCDVGNSRCYPATLYGDINIDITGQCPVSGSRFTFNDHIVYGKAGVVTYADAQDLSEFPTGSIGAVLASHVLEHLPNPEAAVSEWLRVVGGNPDAVFVVTPSWWAPLVVSAPGHFWYWSDGVGGLNGGQKYQLRDPVEQPRPCERSSLGRYRHK